MVNCKFLKSGETLKEIRKLIKKSNEIKIAVAYLKKDGYNEIKEDIKEFLKKKKHLWLLVGIARYYITDAYPLNMLLKLRKEKAKIKLRYYNNRGFHPKVCIFKTGKDVTVVIGSSNLTGGGLRKNIEANILLSGNEQDKIIKDVFDFYDRIWRNSDLLNETILKKYLKNSSISVRIESTGDIDNIPETSLPLKPETEIALEHILININWNPHNFQKGCTLRERTSDIQRACCHEWKVCHEKKWIGGCRSSYLFSEYKYYTFKKYIKKGACAFFIAKNPNVDNKYTLIGFLYMKGKIGQRTKHSKRYHYFWADKKKSILFPLNRNTIVFEEDFTENLPSRPIEWYDAPKNATHEYSSQGWIGKQTQGHRKVSNDDAIFILCDYYERTNDKKVLKIIEELENR